MIGPRVGIPAPTQFSLCVEIAHAVLQQQQEKQQVCGMMTYMA